MAPWQELYLVFAFRSVAAMYTASVCSIMAARLDEVSRRMGPDQWHALESASVRTVAFNVPMPSLLDVTEN
jgi:hypothetical protein